MKTVIDGLVYNTGTAEQIAEWCNCLSRSDHQWCEESLYQTKKGRFFLVGEGGPMSTWYESVGNARRSGSGVRALTMEGALSWCEAADVDAETIESFFSVEEA